jgi:large subunit ribosomal protein L4
MSVQLKKIDNTGKQLASLEVDESIFGLVPNTHVMYLALRRELANARAGTACTKTRAEVRGGGKKPWKQKGTGRARAGSIRSPLWKKGGVTFGPKPRDYSINIPKKVRVLALRSSLSNQIDNIVVIDNFSFLTQPKTRPVADLIATFGLLGKKVLIVADYKATENQYVRQSARNIQGVKITLPHNLSIKDITDAKLILITSAGLDELSGRYSKLSPHFVEKKVA